ncbi:MAG: hypothetical protein JW889_11845 [Verrucomicrobia bacterium]|nr:hypothetical protein [Verrucomicrobiota bacterium]
MRKQHVWIAVVLAAALLVWCQCGGQQDDAGPEAGDDNADAGGNGKESQGVHPDWSEADDIPSDKPSEPVIRQTGEHTYLLDGIALDTNTKTVRFAAAVNQIAENLPLEVLVCTEYGKTHEALFRTSINPTYLNVALKLIGCEGGKPRAGAGDPNVPVGSALEIEVKWTDADGKEQTVQPEGWIWNRMTKAPLADTTWTYTGSVFHMNRFMAEATGTIVNLYVDPSTLIEPPIDEIDDDEALGVYEKAVPPQGTKVELIFTLLPKNEAAEPADAEAAE